MTIIIELPGVPVGKGRARFGRGHAFTPARTRAFETALKWQAKAAMRGHTLLEGPLVAVVQAMMPIPKKLSRKQKAAAELGLILPMARPDADNILKSALDSLNGIVFHDDAQVTDVRIVKSYSSRPRLRIEIKLCTQLTTPALASPSATD